MLTIGFTMGPDGIAMPEIDWPQMIESDNQLVDIVKYIRSCGINATTHITKSASGDDWMLVKTTYTVARYRRGLYQPVPKLIFYDVSNTKVPDLPQPEKVWIFAGTEYVGPVPTPPFSSQMIAYWGAETAQQDDYAALSRKLAEHIPDIRKVVESPCACKGYTGGQIWNVIQHLNDDHHPEKRVRGLRVKDRWTRERIADWLDEVDADLVFDPDLPAKRAAERKSRESLFVEQINSGLISQADLLKKITGDLIPMKPAIDDLSKAVVKLDVAIDEFALSMHENLSKITKCTCPACAPKEES